mmetsp:Transcript_119301/g.207651  ORF Transcript_119301/g.207651 Transcript_119301/m.207651 type:complete len:602 (-) Transcript_119301:84-1889(-)
MPDAVPVGTGQGAPSEGRTATPSPPKQSTMPRRGYRPQHLAGYRADANTHRQSGVYAINPRALKVHPRGFKVLSNHSPLERNMRTYFRLPSLPSRRLLEEGDQVANMMKFMPPDNQPEIVLDGFTLLDACKVEDPEDAIEAVLNDAKLRRVVPEDLAFFNKLEFLDLGENNIQLAHLAALASLLELHLHCNQLTHVLCPAAAFQQLETLNLSYNTLDGSVFLELGKLPNLQRLDLSCNGIASLPQDLSFMGALTQLALENNCLEKEAVFHSLGTLPSLLEVNLNSNKLRRVPRLRPDGFPNLEVLGLANNRFEFFEDLYTLTEYPNLRRVVLWGNNIQSRRKDLDILNYELYQLDIALITDGPLPPKRRVGEFYTLNCSKMVKVSEWRDTRRKPKPQPQPKPQPVPMPTEVGDDSSFFITGTGAVDQGPVEAGVPSSVGAPSHPEPRGHVPPGLARVPEGSATYPQGWQPTNPVGFFSPQRDDDERRASEPQTSPRLGAGRLDLDPDAWEGGLETQALRAVMDLNEPLGTGSDAPDAYVRPPADRRQGQGRVTTRRHRKPGNIRGAIRELKNLLQQPPAPLLGRRPSILGKEDAPPFGNTL